LVRKYQTFQSSTRKTEISDEIDRALYAAAHTAKSVLANEIGFPLYAETKNLLSNKEA